MGASILSGLLLKQTYYTPQNLAATFVKFIINSHYLSPHISETIVSLFLNHLAAALHPDDNEMRLKLKINDLPI
ncbi:hypothetical protein BFC17_16680 [Alteromonas lipolytica]|uniref:Uncharacterized protein n=1 Tax=Alteromonas lipolytica TaxID=1856405 RepID=A0A1E8FGU3_9ALTE|nr:hypothetical protein BFC17_16680 [Alteromonas lipolytica]